MIDALLQEGVQTNVFPLCRLEVLHRGRAVISTGNAPAGLPFDLASVTKVMCTTGLLLELGFDLQTSIARWVPTRHVTLEDLLTHRSGLPAFRPFFATARTRAEVIEQVIAEPLEAPPRTRTVYSDLGFILLGHVLELERGRPLDELYATYLATRLGLGAGFHRNELGGPGAPTGRTRPREPAPGQEGLWALTEVPELTPGFVDDDNAFAMGGVAGHAGLFGTALDVARFGQAIVDERWRPRAGWPLDSTPGSTRTLGFDTPGATGSSCGEHFGRAGPLGAVGHLGFTGTSVWVDLDRELVVAFLTNRVALGRANVAIRAFRPRVHDAVLDALGLR